MLQQEYNPTPARREQEIQFLTRCLARDILRRYPNKQHRQHFYARYQAKHGQAKLDRLLTAVRSEYNSFLGWCALFSRVSAHSTLLDYLAESSTNICPIDPRGIASPFVIPQESPLHPLADTWAFSSEPSPTAAPWWTDVPWLAPKGQGVTA